MNILYVLTLILIIGLHMLIYKKEEKQNILKHLILNIGLLLCYNIVICVILSFVKIKSTLPVLSAINIIFSIFLGMKIYKDKKIQKYFIDKMDIISIIVIIVITIIISIMRFGLPINLTHSITDAATHYLAANEFYHYSNLLMEENSDILGFFKLDFLMPGAYVNTGILFKIFSPLVSETYFCILFIIFEISMWGLSGILMYTLLSDRLNKKILPLIFAIIYMLEYPLNTMISGFSYLQVGLNIIICILIIMQLDIKSYYKYLLMFIANFGLMFSYYYFAPVVFLAVFIHILIDIKTKNEKIVSLPNILKVSMSLIIPGLFGVIYFIIFQIINYGESHLKIGSINIPGPIYKNLIMNMIVFVGLAIYYNIKKHKDISNKMLILGIIFTVVLFIGMKLQKVSEYYYYKLYYMLWIFVIVVGFYSTNILKEKYSLTNFGIGLYIVGVIIAIIFNKNILFFDIYRENFYVIKSEEPVITNSELEIFEYFNENINNILDDNTFLYMCSNGRQRWSYPLTKNAYIFINTTWTDPFVDIKQFLESNKKYCVIFKTDNKDIYENIEKIQNIKILFKNEDGVIIEKL